MSLEIWIPVIVALISSTTSYLLARSKAKGELRTSEQETRNKIETMQANHKQELEKLEREFQLKADYEERGIQTELAKEFIKKPEMQKVIMREIMKQMK